VLSLERHRARRDEAGFSLVELIVVIGLLAVVGTAVMTGVISGMRATATVEDQVNTTSKIRTAAQRLAREIRTADPVETGTAYSDRIQVRVVRNGVCSRLIYRLVGTNLLQYTQTPLTPAPAAIGSRTVANACITPAASDTLAAGLTSTTLAAQLVAGSAVFTYYDAAGAVMNFNQTGASRPLEKNIVRIRITLQRTASGKKPVRVSTDVQIRNGEANRTVNQ
jgi:prepilin-type N-terminal cleavage/methylation domain-containing protein